MIEKIINSKLVVNHIQKIVSNPIYTSKFLLGASVAKDAFEYGISAVQSLDNDDIPSEKRKLVAAMDASTGLLSCFSQLVVGFGLTNKKVQKKIGDFLFKGLAKAGEFKTLEKCKAGLTIAAPLIISTVLVKRILVPMISAPIASYCTDYLAKINKDDSKDKDDD